MNEKLGRLNDSLQRQVEREAEQNQQLEKLNQALQQNLQRSVELCFKTMQTFYPMLGTQSRRACELCDSFAESLGLPREDQEILHISALLHDIGLVGISRTLIKQWQRSPKSLSDAERRLIMQHPILGQDLVGFIDNLEAVGTLIRAHHERFDGTGYPDQLAGDAIPRLARLLAVAVSYAESPLSEEETVQAIKRGSGSAFDPEAVRLFLRCHPNAASPRGQRQVLLAELRPGMVLARAIYTANGLLLFPEGQVLTTQYIDKLLNHHRVNPINQSLLVYC
jgi:response regulator RpfG family c-di-GMP phosphodiesterase